MFVCLKIIFSNELNLIKATCSIISLSMILRTIKLECLSLADYWLPIRLDPPLRNTFQVMHSMGRLLALSQILG
jgi:hypothetical protein